MNKKSIFGLVILILVIVVLVLVATTSKQESQTAQTTGSVLPGIQTSVAPWEPETDNLRKRLNAIGLPALSEEGSALHIHEHLDIFIHGESIGVPAGIGINETERFISPIHTHDTSGVIHVESPTVQDFTLGQFFDIWGLRFTETCIGSYCADTTNTLTVFVNGAKFVGDPRSLILAAHQEIVVAFGTALETPKTIPSTYAFPAGE